MSTHANYMIGNIKYVNGILNTKDLCNSFCVVYKIFSIGIYSIVAFICAQYFNVMFPRLFVCVCCNRFQDRGGNFNIKFH